MGSLEGKCALVTGGTTGLGLAIAERFRREGARVVITGRDRGLGERAERDLGPGTRFIAADAADPGAVASCVGAAADHLGGLDVLVNNAGIGVTARLIDTPLADYDRVMNVNIRGYLLYAQHAYPHLARRRGCMIHVASDAGIWGEQATGLYSVTKAAVVMLGKMLALDGGPDGVRSNVLCPGDIWPGMRHMAPPGQQDRDENAGDWPVPPIGRVGQARDVAAAAVFYASDEAGFVTGTTLLVDGGMTAGYLQRERGVLPAIVRSMDCSPEEAEHRSRAGERKGGMGVEGHADARFGPVRECFAEVVAGQPGTGAAFAAWCAGRLAADLWGGAADLRRTRPWEPGTAHGESALFTGT